MHEMFTARKEVSACCNINDGKENRIDPRNQPKWIETDVESLWKLVYSNEPLNIHLVKQASGRCYYIEALSFR